MPLNNQNKLKAFEYALVRLAQWYVSLDDNRAKLLTDFNLSNDFGYEKVLLFPFFICTANGDRKILFNDFCNRIYPTPLGLVDKDLEKAINADSLSYFQIGLFDCNLVSAETINNNSQPEAILSYLKYDSNNEQDDLFRRIIEGIDNSIRCIRYELQYSDFVKWGVDALSYQSQEHNSWKVFSDENILQSQEDQVIPSSFLIEEKSPFASSNNKRDYFISAA